MGGRGGGGENDSSVISLVKEGRLLTFSYLVISCFALFLGCNIWSCLIWSRNLDEIYEVFILFHFGI